jgi:hypothetical protein
MSNRLLSRNHILFIPVNRRNVLLGMGVVGAACCGLRSCLPESQPAIDRLENPLPTEPMAAMNELGLRVQGRVTAARPSERINVPGTSIGALRVTNKEGGHVTSSSTDERHSINVSVANPDGLNEGVSAQISQLQDGTPYIEAHFQRSRAHSEEPIVDITVLWSAHGGSVSSPNVNNGAPVNNQELAARTLGVMFAAANSLLSVQDGDPTPALPAINLQ